MTKLDTFAKEAEPTTNYGQIDPIRDAEYRAFDQAELRVIQFREDVLNLVEDVITDLTNWRIYGRNE